jgi:hypothetical protein
MYFALVISALIAVGCASGPKVDWNERVGHYQLDDAIRELGPPDNSATLTDGTTVAEWLRGRGGTYVNVMAYGGYYPYHYRPYYWYPPEPGYYNVNRTPDNFLRLTFGPDRVLREWKRVYK